jgi:hypothetical protein
VVRSNINTIPINIPRSININNSNPRRLLNNRKSQFILIRVLMGVGRVIKITMNGGK